MSKSVEMSVKCIDEFCVNCNELDIEVEHIDFSSASETFYQNYIYCKHWKRCAAIENAIRKNLEFQHA